MGIRSLSSIKLVAQISANIRNQMLGADVDDLASFSMAGSSSITLTNGVEENQANRGWQFKNHLLTSGASLVVDLYDFVGVDAGAGDGNDNVGQAIVMEEIAGIMIKNENAVDAAGSLEIEPDSSNGWTPIGTHTVANGGALEGQGVLLKGNPSANGFDVTDASSHRVKLTANGDDVLLSMYVIGRHDDEASSSSSSSPSSSSSSSQSSSSSSRSSSSSSSQSSSSPSSLSSQSSLDESSSLSSSSPSSYSSSSSSSSVSTSSSSSSSISTSSSSSSSVSSSSQSSQSSASSSS